MSNETKAQVGNPFEGPKLEESNKFFDSLDNQFSTENMELPTPAPEQVTSQQVIPDAAGKQGNEKVVTSEPIVDWKKRYDDSSIEARRQKAKLDELQPFESVINFLKEDSGAVDMLQSYLKSGGEVPKNVQAELQLDEDFMFDMDDATKNPESDSGKLFNKMVEKKAQVIVNNTIQQERQKSVAVQQKQAKLKLRNDFMTKRNLTEEQMRDLELKAKEHVMTYDDLDLILNKDKITQNVQKSTQSDMMNQMNAVRNIPTSIGGANNAGQNMTSEEQMFNSIFGDQFKTDENPF